VSTASYTRGLALVLAGALGCAPALGPGGGGTAGLRGTDTRTAADAGIAVTGDAVARMSGACPVAAPNADAVIARVDGDTLTGCDVYVAWHRATRVGLREDDPTRLFARVLADALRAAEVRRGGNGRDGGVDLEIDRVLAEALLRQEALDAMPHVPSGAPSAAPTEPAVDGPAADPEPPQVASAATPAPSAWVRARALVLPSRPAALAAIAALREGATFESLLPRSIDPNAARDHGDLGMVPPEGNGLVPGAVARAVFALTAPGEVGATPLEVSRTVTYTVRRRTRTRRVSGWWVVALVERADGTGAGAGTGTGAAVRRARDRYLHLRAAARLRWQEQLAPRVRAAIVPGALEQVRVRARE
jgi:hypothetical protein